MSVDEESVKTGGAQASSTSLQLSERAGSYSAISVTVEAPEFAASCPVLAAAAPANHANDALAEPRDAQQRAKGSENILNRRNTWQHSKQQQQTKLAKRRNTANSSFKHPSSGKRRRRATSESDSVLPTNFLLGGNIFDPLNLNSLLDEEVNRALNAETPKSSPLPARSRDPVEILIPRDITDPLNLKSGIADSNVLASPFKRKRHRNRHHGGGGGGVLGAGSGISSAQMNSLEQEKGYGIPTPLPGVLASVSTPDVSKESNSFSSATGDSNELSAENSTLSKGETASVCTEESTSVSQHPNRRKRRRNSGKMELPLTQSTPVAKSGPGDRRDASGWSRQPQSFHTPRSGSKAGPGGRQHHHHHQQHNNQAKKKFQYGNYNKYYGYRNPSKSEDPRVHLLRREWFEGKDVLDLGCNLGHLTLYIAKMHRPARILGLDIDGALVHAARKNIRHYLSELQAQEARQSAPCTKRVEEAEHEKHKEPASVDENRTPAEGETGTRRQDGTAEEMERGDGHSPPTELSVSFPVSLQISRGPIAAPPLSEASSVRRGEFPSNVSFIKANYVLENDGLLLTQRQEYDVILCLSVTKWVHLNWGDTGLKRLFKRVYRHLRSGGLFILEPQPWESYVRRKKLTDNINKNFHSIRLKPDQFSSYLTTEVGFTRFEYLGAPKCSIKGFQRPIFLFHK
eukprot:XP_003971308.1 PREDICTED: 7SK snRNA methylphosphate capping enzyme-like [Takifugu rubripes]